MRSGRRLLLAVALAAVGPAAWASVSGDELLRRSEQAEREHNYRGVREIRTFVRGKAVEAQVRVLHQKPATTRIEYLSPPSMVGTVVLHIGADRWRRSPRDGQWHRLTAAPEGDATELLRRNYHLRVQPGTPVAGRPCLLLTTAPKHPGNPSKRIWVDQATGLVLGSELLSWQQESISASSFREIEIDPDLREEAELLRPPAAAAPPRSPGELGFRPVQPRYVPPGYAFRGTDVIGLGEHRGAHLRYSDGLNSISVFQAPAKAFAGRSFSDRQWSFTQVVAWHRGDMAYAVVGDIDPAELRKMADSMGAPRETRRRGR